MDARGILAVAAATVAAWFATGGGVPDTAEPARCAAAVAIAYASLDVSPPAPPAPPTPDSPCGGKCSSGVYRPDGRIETRCGTDCPCGCQRKSDAVRCERCLGTGFVMGGDGVVRPCRSCPAPGSAPAR